MLSVRLANPGGKLMEAHQRLAFERASETMQAIIAHRRDRKDHTRAEIRFLAQAAAMELVPDYQLSAWLMAAFLNPLNETETAWLTEAMADSGERLDLRRLPKPWIDKHSTGGVGDKTSLVLMPLLAACGVTVVKMSGRGLGITGGTVDKLASIPGFRTDLTAKQMQDQAARIGIAVTGPSGELAPADKTLYALRDATGTVENLPFLVSSILSKKLAGGAESVMLDVKTGFGALIQPLDKSRELAGWLVRIGRKCGLNVRAAVTDMNAPLGVCVGNALEVREAFDTLAGRTNGRFRELCVRLAGYALDLSGTATGDREGREMAERAMQSGAALGKAREWVAAQGGDVAVVDEPRRLPAAEVVVEVRHAGPRAYVQELNARHIGETVVRLGGGRTKKDDKIDPGVGLELPVTVGGKLEEGDLVARIHAAGARDAEAAEASVREALVLSERPTPMLPLIYDLV
ncbi:MAG: thymidine phosphorylase [Fimbriimonadaceae bacterium]|nr:thymidine phosphorylase [Fimbriimonadaceae bacterium]